MMQEISTYNSYLLLMLIFSIALTICVNYNCNIFLSTWHIERWAKFMEVKMLNRCDNPLPLFSPLFTPTFLSIKHNFSLSFSSSSTSPTLSKIGPRKRRRMQKPISSIFQSHSFLNLQVFYLNNKILFHLNFF